VTSITILEQRKALAIQEALETTYKNIDSLGLDTRRIAETRAEPLLQPEHALPILVAELARALGYKREARKALGVALGELYERVEALESSATSNE
jgi:hypothetical protein